MFRALQHQQQPVQLLLPPSAAASVLLLLLLRMHGLVEVLSFPWTLNICLLERARVGKWSVEHRGHYELHCLCLL
jgi:hypothetical protein